MPRRTSLMERDVLFDRKTGGIADNIRRGGR
jgi:hypothetical protein